MRALNDSHIEQFISDFVPLLPIMNSFLLPAYTTFLSYLDKIANNKVDLFGL